MVLLENVSYMLRLDQGNAMGHLVERLEALGYRWAYRVVDARAFGVPQRRQRVVMLASLNVNPASIVLGTDADEPDGIDVIGEVRDGATYGFYWTEGRRGLGWTRDAIPTLKGGSRIGIPSAPAVWDPSDGTFGTPGLEDAERLQGFESRWTEPADDVYAKPRRGRWTLVGNAVCVPMASWIGERIVTDPSSSEQVAGQPLRGRWPRAAYGGTDGRFAVDVSLRPVQDAFVPVSQFLKSPLEPLSERASRGFLRRARRKQTALWRGIPRQSR